MRNSLCGNICFQFKMYGRKPHTEPGNEQRKTCKNVLSYVKGFHSYVLGRSRVREYIRTPHDSAKEVLSSKFSVIWSIIEWERIICLMGGGLLAAQAILALEQRFQAQRMWFLFVLFGVA